MTEFWARSLVSGMQEAANLHFAFTSLLLSLPLSRPLSLNQ